MENDENIQKIIDINNNENNLNSSIITNNIIQGFTLKQKESLVRIIAKFIRFVFITIWECKTN